jgi:hypothetical protein
MILASPDVASSLRHWELAEYVSEGFVILGCAGEFVADLATCIPRRNRRHLERWSTILLVVALSIGLKCLVRTNELSGSVIGSLGDKAEKADRKANTAIADSSTALTKSGQALDKSGRATEAAGMAQDRAGTVAKQTAELNRGLLAAKTQLETVDAKRAELEKSLVNLAVCNAPRVIPLWSMGNKETSVDPLKPFARQATIEFVPDAEARRAALNIAGALDKGGWKISRFAPVDGIDDGVDIEPFMAPTPSTPSTMSTQEWQSSWGAEIQSEEAAGAVLDFLHSYNWQATRGWPTDEKGQLIHDPKIMPPDSLRIRVGLYPAVTYVSPPGAQHFATAIAQAGQEMEKHRKQIEAEELKREDEILKHLTAQQATEFKARREQRNKEQKLRMERYSSGPCQPLIPLLPAFR